MPKCAPSSEIKGVYDVTITRVFILWVGIHKSANSQLPISASITERLEYCVLLSAHIIPADSLYIYIYIRSYSLLFIVVRNLPFWILNCNLVCFLSRDWAHPAAIPQTTIITSLRLRAGASCSFYRMVKVANGIIFIWDDVKTWCQSYEILLLRENGGRIYLKRGNTEWKKNNVRES